MQTGRQVVPLYKITGKRINMEFYFIPGSESSAYLEQIKGILFAVKNQSAEGAGGPGIIRGNKVGESE